MNYFHEFIKLPGKKGALACSDPAGSNVCFAIMEMYRIEQDSQLLLFSNRNNFPDNYPVGASPSIPDFLQLGIDCLFTGTSHPDSSGSFEINCIKAARKNRIYTISFIDHWINFKLRFEGLNNNQLPNEIWVIDEVAKKLAIEEGLPEDRLVVRQNPYHHYLEKYWHSNFKSKAYLETLGIPSTGFHILFAPDPLSLRKRSEEVGFSEVTALNNILEILQSVNKEVFLILKLHPLQPVEILEEVFEGFNQISYKILVNADVRELICASDLIIGFYSNFLIEAHILKKNVIRYFPGIRSADLLKHSEIGNVCYSKEDLQNELNHFVHE